MHLTQLSIDLLGIGTATITGLDTFEQQDMSDVTLYPNPSNGFIKITHLGEYRQVNIQIIDVLGKVLKSYSQVQDSYDVSDLPQGAYKAVIKAGSQSKTLNFVIN